MIDQGHHALAGTQILVAFIGRIHYNRLIRIIRLQYVSAKLKESSYISFLLWIERVRHRPRRYLQAILVLPPPRRAHKEVSRSSGPHLLEAESPHRCLLVDLLHKLRVVGMRCKGCTKRPEIDTYLMSIEHGIVVAHPVGVHQHFQ